LRIGIVVSQFNSRITERLLSGAIAALKKGGVNSSDIHIAEVPGAFELPGVAQEMGLTASLDAIICLGAVIQGETEHFHYICSEVSRGIGQVALHLRKPVIFGVLTTGSVRQAAARSGSKVNKGVEAADTAIEMALLYRRLGKCP
jgi:6,7-dimethyl-8-ribityllumazine synthase